MFLMHDLGQSSLEYRPMLNEIFGNPRSGSYAGETSHHEFGNHEFGSHEFGNHEFGSHEVAMHELQESPLQETFHESGEMGHEFSHELGHELGHEVHEFQEIGGSGNEVLSHEDEIALAAELMNVQSDEELQQFLGRLVRKAGRFVRSPTGRILTGALRQIARRALPIVAKAAGTALGGPLGGMAAGVLANAAGKALGLEVSGMTQEEANFANARQFIRFANNAARRAAINAARTGSVNPTMIARTAVTQAARQFAPGLLGPQFGTIPAPQMPVQGGRRGIWVRRGNAIIIYGA
jgi:hypothetical protein